MFITESKNFTSQELRWEVEVEYSTVAGGLSPRCSCLGGNLLHIVHTRQQLQPAAHVQPIQVYYNPA